ncbi:MAG: hypothetical protein H6861_01520 [Rhodospirillales bacterium]|nr:hypothetical protein [Rhodospirillales bacterium]
MSEEDSKLEQLSAAAKNAGQAVVETLKDDESEGRSFKPLLTAQSRLSIN